MGLESDLQSTHFWINRSRQPSLKTMEKNSPHTRSVASDTEGLEQTPSFYQLFQQIEQEPAEEHSAQSVGNQVQDYVRNDFTRRRSNDMQNMFSTPAALNESA